MDTQTRCDLSGGSQASGATPVPKTPPRYLRSQIGKRDPWNNRDGTPPETIDDYDRARASTSYEEVAPPEPPWPPAEGADMVWPPPPPPIHPPKAPPKAPPGKSKAQRNQEYWDYQKARTTAIHVGQQKWARDNRQYNPVMVSPQIPGDPRSGTWSGMHPERGWMRRRTWQSGIARYRKRVRKRLRGVRHTDWIQRCDSRQLLLVPQVHNRREAAVNHMQY